MKEIRTLYNDRLRKLCIDKNWYTLGNNGEYENLLSRTNKKNITTKNIIDIATDIKNHSDTEYEIENICFEIANICYSYFEKIEE